MKKLIAFLIIALVTLVLMSATSTYNTTVSSSEPWGAIVYSGTVSCTDTSVNSAYYTQSMLIGGVDKTKYGWLRVVCTEVGTEDVNVFEEYSNDRLNWVAGTTDTDQDAVGTTAVIDTIGITNGTACQKYQSYPYIRLKFVLGSANDTGATITYSIGFSKPAASAKEQLSSVSNRRTS